VESNLVDGVGYVGGRAWEARLWLMIEPNAPMEGVQ
jgi:hypothetical protein